MLGASKSLTCQISVTQDVGHLIFLDGADRTSGIDSGCMTNVLNPVEQSYPDFFVEWDVLASHPVPTIGTGDILRHSDWDTRMLARHFVPAHGMVPHLVSHGTSHQHLNPWWQHCWYLFPVVRIYLKVHVLAQKTSTGSQISQI